MPPRRRPPPSPRTGSCPSPRPRTQAARSVRREDSFSYLATVARPTGRRQRSSNRKSGGIVDWWTAGRALVLIVHGLDDVSAPPANRRLLKQGLGDRPRLVEVPRVAHALPFLTAILADSETRLVPVDAVIALGVANPGNIFVVLCPAP